jgi:glycosyltransferase involved in cell wall biosynthesis
MNIAMDLTQIPADKTGIGIYALNLVREITRLNHTGQRFHFYLFVQDDDHEWAQITKNNSRCRIIPLKSTLFRKLILRFFFEQVLLPLKCRNLKIHAIFSFHYTMPYLTGIPRIVTVPDLTFYLFPGMHQKSKRLYFKSLLPLSLAWSRKIVTISESTKQDLLKRFRRVNPGKVEVIHLGVEIKHPPAQAKEHLEKLGLAEKKYLLFVGTLEPRKNLPNLIEAFHQVITAAKKDKKEYKLVIAGKKGWFYRQIFETVKKHHLEESVIFTGYVEDEVKQSLLAHAFLFIYPSFYEGFGLPVLEAMVYGVPVICGNTSSLPEVGGDAALLIDPHNPWEIAQAILKGLSDRAWMEKRSKQSVIQARKFSWQLTAEKTLVLLSSLKNKETS